MSFRWEATISRSKIRGTNTLTLSTVPATVFGFPKNLLQLQFSVTPTSRSQVLTAIQALTLQPIKRALQGKSKILTPRKLTIPWLSRATTLPTRLSLPTKTIPLRAAQVLMLSTRAQVMTFSTAAQVMILSRAAVVLISSFGAAVKAMTLSPTSPMRILSACQAVR